MVGVGGAIVCVWCVGWRTARWRLLKVIAGSGLGKFPSPVTVISIDHRGGHPEHGALSNYFTVNVSSQRVR